MNGDDDSYTLLAQPAATGGCWLCDIWGGSASAYKAIREAPEGLTRRLLSKARGKLSL
mgnify:CR=1 FL=1